MLLTLLNAALLSASSSSKFKVDWDSLFERLTDWSIEIGKSILGAILIYIIGRFIIKQINRLVSKILEKRKFEISVQTFLKSLLSLLLNLILAFAIIAKLGVETTSFAAILASAGVAIGMALSGNLSNFAGGLIILVFKPFKVGDYIDGPSNASGTVKEIQIFHTILSTVDNKIIYVPNGSLSSNAIVNYSKQETRRAEWVFGVEYGEDYERVKAVLERIIAADERILQTPAPFIGLGSLSASSVDIKVRVWTKSSDYWDVVFDMNRIVYETFNKEGIGFPFPQLTVHQAKD
ncbi:mechanosensitive ion channel family protein [Phocaeicola barnesiae]